MSGFGLPKTALDEVPVEQRRQVLLDLSRLSEPTLSMLGVEPGNGPVYVVDAHNDVAAGPEDEALKGYARSNGLDVTNPIVSGNDHTGEPNQWEVHMSSQGSSPQILCSASTREEALEGMRQALRELCGDLVLDLMSWAEAQNAGSLEDIMLAPPVSAQQKGTPFVVWERIALKSLPLAPHVASARSDLTPKKTRRKAAYEMVNSPQGLGSNSGGALSSDWNLPVLRDDNILYANHHDMLAALRLGLNIENVLPWPNTVAHKFLVAEELRWAMRLRGYVEVTDFDPNKRVHLRVSLPEYSQAITGIPAAKNKKPRQQIKPDWPPINHTKQRVVIILNRARLALEEEPEWETVSIRNIFQCAGHLWVEQIGPVEKRKGKKVVPAKKI